MPTTAKPPSWLYSTHHLWHFPAVAADLRKAGLADRCVVVERDQVLAYTHVAVEADDPAVRRVDVYTGPGIGWLARRVAAVGCATIREEACG
jgi:hypothetical protein